MITMDCLGDICPVPVMLLQNALPKIEKGERVMLVTDHSCVPGSVGEFCKKKGLSLFADEVMPGVWELHIAAGEAQQKVSDTICEK